MRKTFKIGGVVLLAVLLLLAVFGLRGDDLIKERKRMRPGDFIGRIWPGCRG